MATDPYLHLTISYHSDFSADNTWNGWINIGRGWYENGNFEIGGQYKTRSFGRLEASVSPGYSYNAWPRQWVTVLDGGREETYGKRYIFSFIERNTFWTRFRLNYAFSSDLTLEIYAEPFASSGRYFKFGELQKPGTLAMRFYGEAPGTKIRKNEDGDYVVGDDSESFELGNPDFRYLSFRSNAVLRWEFMPGSILYLVWQQNRSDYGMRSSTIGPESLYDALAADGINSFAIKISYWLPVD